MREAKEFTTNPLGIIALFISLIYGFACLVVGTAGTTLEIGLIYPLIWFLVCFPIMILISFLFLVIFHHQKLYAPKDYKDERNFIKSIDRNRQMEILDNEIAEITEVDEKGRNPLPDSTDEVDDGSEKIENDIEFGSTDTGSDSGTKDKSTIHNNIRTNLEVMKDYILMEELAIRKLEKEYETSIHRQVQLKLKNSIIEVDGFFEMKNKYLLFEIKYIKQSNLPQSIMRKIDIMAECLSMEDELRAKLVVVIVHESGYGEKLKKQLYDYFRNNKKVEFKFYNKTKLLESFDG